MPWFVTRAVDPRGEARPGTRLPHRQPSLDPACSLLHGIYAVVPDRRALVHAVASFGRRPTYDNGAPLLEVHVFDIRQDLYGHMIDIAFAAFLRPERKSLRSMALIVQMDEDSRRARKLLSEG